MLLDEVQERHWILAEFVNGQDNEVPVFCGGNRLVNACKRQHVEANDGNVQFVPFGDGPCESSQRPDCGDEKLAVRQDAPWKSPLQLIHQTFVLNNDAYHTHASPSGVGTTGSSDVYSSSACSLMNCMSGMELRLKS
jgi:hypothetical protein